MRNKRRQRHLHVCDARGLSKPPWWQDERERADVLALSLPVRDRLRLFAGLGRAVSYGTGLDGASKAAYAFDCSVGLTLRCCIAQYETFSRTGYAPSRADHGAA